MELPVNQEYMPGILLHQTWQTNLLWTMNPPTKMRMDFLIITPKLLDISYSIYKKTFCEARVNLEVCSYLADEPSLGDGDPINRA